MHARVLRSSDKTASEKGRVPLGRVLPVLALLTAGCGRPAAESRPESTKSAAVRASSARPAGEQKVELKILDFNGIEQLIASHWGKVVVMDAWSTSCAPCVKEFPRLVALAGRYSPESLACISLSFDYQGIGTPEEQVPKVKKFLESQGATFDNVLSSEDADVLYPKFHLASVPAVFVYDKTGQLRKRFDNEDAQGEADVFNYDQVGARGRLDR